MRGAALNRATPGCGCATCRNAHVAMNRAAEAVPAHEPDLVDRIGIDESADRVDQTGPMLDAVMAAAGRAKSFEEFGREITVLYGSIPTGGLAKRLAIATIEARGLERVQDDV